MNLYAVCPSYAPGNEVTFILAEDDAMAMKDGTFVAANDVVRANYFSPTAQVYLVAENLSHVGDAYATDAPSSWAWAHPAVEENALREACDEIEYGAGP